MKITIIPTHFERKPRTIIIQRPVVNGAVLQMPTIVKKQHLILIKGGK